MPHMVKIYTKKGDDGQTSLFGGQRISKSDPRPEAFGTLDEVCAILGVARAAADNPDLQAVIHSIQEDLFLLGAELATAPEDRPRLSVEQITPAHTAR
ncbi:MAG: ATP:cob(I)alamin adenosyltransferase, partial [candidate division NC10 bacterium]